MKRRRGIALVMTLLILALVIVLAGQLAFVVGVDSRLSRNQLADTKNFALSYGGVELAKTFLRSDFEEQESAFDGHRDLWADPAETGQAIGEEGDAQVNLRIEPEEGKLNLNLLVREDTKEMCEPLTQQILVALGYDENLYEPLLENIDAATGGGEKPLPTIYDIISDEIPYEMVVGDSLGLIELNLLPDADEVVGLNEVFSVLSTGDLNVNVIHKLVFQAICTVLPDSVTAGTEPANLADKYVDYRGEPGGEGEDITEVKDLANVEGFEQTKFTAFLEGEDGDDPPAVLRSLFVVDSITFKVTITSNSDDLQSTTEAYIRREAEEGRCRLLFWKELETPPGSR